jgi:maltose alpha-D-glucosyltransferase/alpha-amylase
VPPFAGSLEYIRESEASSAIAIVQGLVPNEGDGWKWTTEELERFYENCARTTFPQASESARDHVGAYIEAASVLGKRTAELHLALAAETEDPAFTPEPFSTGDIEATAGQMREEAAQALELLKSTLSRLPDEALEMAGLALGRRRQIIDRLLLPVHNHSYGKRIRTHGDYHLGQVLRARNDFVILDFEGEPARPLAQRRAKYSPLKDVAGMLRSFSYAANSTLMTYTMRHPEDFASLAPWARLWEQTVAAEFLSSYRQTAEPGNVLPESDEGFRRLLDACLLEKGMYELMYELNNRPTWVRIPLAGILALTS